MGCGLEGVLQHRRDVLSGIINGVDYREWNPATDPHLAGQLLRSRTSQTGKAACKAALQQRLGLPGSPDAPLVAFIGRLTDQKGIDLLAAVIRDWVQSHDVQWVILGTGEPELPRAVRPCSRERFPQKVAARLEFSNPLAHRIEAGADIFLMPSRYEPCGLNQLYSLKYGTVPVVRATGGLADTITDANEKTLGRWHGQRLSLPRVQPAGADRDARPGLQRLRPTGRLAATDRRPACGRTGRGPRSAAQVRRAVSHDGQPRRVGRRDWRAMPRELTRRPASTACVHTTCGG